MPSRLFENGSSGLMSQCHHPTKTTVAVASVSLAFLLGLAGVAHNDYQTYMSYGPGGLPYNVVGWFGTTFVLGPIKSEKLSTNLYNGQADGRSWLPDDDFHRKGERPVLGPHAIPQRQLNQIPDKQFQEVRFFPGVVDKARKVPSTIPMGFRNWSISSNDAEVYL